RAAHARGASRDRGPRARMHQHAALPGRRPGGHRPARFRYHLARADGPRGRAARPVAAPGVSGSAGPPWPILQPRRLTKRFRGLTAVDRLDLAVRGGEIRGLIGPNGSGKTTTVNLLSGLYRADGGEIFLRGVRTDRLRPHAVTACGVARTFQIAKLFGNMT